MDGRELSLPAAAATEPALTVREDGVVLRYGFDDLMKYHGPGFPGGVAHAFTAMRRALPLLAPDGLVERRGVSIETSFGGPGGRDAFEMALRVVSREAYTVDKSLGDPWKGDGHRENYFFRFTYEGASLSLVIRPGHVRDEFIRLGRKADRTPAETERHNWLKQEMADRLLAADPSDVYEVVA